MIPFLAADPLYADGIDGTVILIVIGKVLVTFALLLLLVMLIIWFERKVVSDMQNRVGPNQAGPWGLLISLADAIKLFFKEQSIPDAADRRAFFIAPYMSLLPAFLAFAVLPIGGEIHIAGHTTYMQLADLPMGVLWVLAMSGIGVYGVLLAGWGSGRAGPGDQHRCPREEGRHLRGCRRLDERGVDDIEAALPQQGPQRSDPTGEGVT